MRYEKLHQHVPQVPVELDGPSVLLVDDNEHLLNAVSSALTAHGYRIRTAENAGQALFSLDEIVPDIIICDVMMPGMDGFEFQQCVQARSEWCSVPFIFLTALSDPEDVRYGKSKGCDDYLTKPFSVEDLMSVIEGKLTLTEARKTVSYQNLEGYRRRIIHTLSHEFRTPLVAINTGAELLLEQTDNLEQDKVRHLLESIQRGGNRLQRLVEDFMTLQQIDSGTAESVQQRLSRNISPEELIGKAVEDFIDEYSLERRGRSLTVEIDKDAPVSDICVCESQVANAFQRILCNADKFSQPGSPIVVKVYQQNSEVVFSVRDHGCGLSHQAREHAKQIFAQIGREKLEQQGCGLGLTIANYFVELNCGQIEFIEPVGGTGLEVRFIFPAA